MPWSSDNTKQKRDGYSIPGIQYKYYYNNFMGRKLSEQEMTLCNAIPRSLYV